MKNKLLFLLLVLPFLGHSQNVASFESWRPLLSGQLTAPNGWYATDSIVKVVGTLTNPTGTFVAQTFKETPGANSTGNAMRIVTKNQDTLPGILPACAVPCIASNAKINVNTSTGGFTFEGGLPIAYVPYYASFWVKTSINGGDSSGIVFEIIDDSDGSDNLIAYADTTFGSNINSFTKITLLFKPTGITGFTPKILRITATSSINFTIDSTTGAFANLTDGTSITIDECEVGAPTGMVQSVQFAEPIEVYPTKTSNVLHVNSNTMNPNATIRFIDLNGRLIETHLLNTSENIIPYLI
jgi:hypothetical protein